MVDKFQQEDAIRDRDVERRVRAKERFELQVVTGISYILTAMQTEFGLDTAGEDFKGTAERVARVYSEIMAGMLDDGTQLKEILSKSFPSKSDEMITVGPTHVWSICPHHLLPVEMEIWVGYLPNGRVLGLSKIPRMVELIAKKPDLQENTTSRIAETLNGLQGPDYDPHFGTGKPIGAGCLIRGRHLCMAMRGVKKEAITTTTSLQGSFSSPAVRQEFLAAVQADIQNGRL